MKAAIFYGTKDIRVENVAEPQMVGPGEVRLKPFWCGICGTDVHEYAMGPIVIPSKPHKLNGSILPQILGHEFSAEVLELGKGVTNVKVGDRVSVMPLLSCGVCYFCSRGDNHLCTSMACIGLSCEWGGIAEQAVVPAANVFKLHDSVSDVAGALVEPLAVAAYGVDRGNVRPGDTILITGAGPIGALAAIYAENLGARVFVSELNPNRKKLIDDLGIATLLDPTKDDVIGTLKDATGGLGVDAVIECSGNERALQTSVKAVRSGGFIVQTGLHTRPASIEPMEFSEREITYTGTWCYPVTDWPRIIELIGRRGLPVEKVVSSQIAMDDIVAKGFEELVSPTGNETKVLVRGF